MLWRARRKDWERVSCEGTDKAACINKTVISSHMESPKSVVVADVFCESCAVLSCNRVMGEVEVSKRSFVNCLTDHLNESQANFVRKDVPGKVQVLHIKVALQSLCKLHSSHATKR